MSYDAKRMRATTEKGTFDVIKDEQGKWVLRKDGEFRLKLDSRTTGRMLLAMLAGDLSGAPAYYRRILKNAERKMGRANALRYAILDAQMLGLSPAHVNVDPKTGEPL